MILALLLFWGGSVWRRGQVDVWADAKTACAVLVEERRLAVACLERMTGEGKWRTA